MARVVGHEDHRVREPVEDLTANHARAHVVVDHRAQPKAEQRRACRFGVAAARPRDVHLGVLARQLAAAAPQAVGQLGHAFAKLGHALAKLRHAGLDVRGPRLALLDRAIDSSVPHCTQVPQCPGTVSFRVVLTRLDVDLAGAALDHPVARGVGGEVEAGHHQQRHHRHRCAEPQQRPFAPSGAFPAGTARPSPAPSADPRSPRPIRAGAFGRMPAGRRGRRSRRPRCRTPSPAVRPGVRCGPGPGRARTAGLAARAGPRRAARSPPGSRRSRVPRGGRRALGGPSASRGAMRERRSRSPRSAAGVRPPGRRWPPTTCRPVARPRAGEGPPAAPGRSPRRPSTCAGRREEWGRVLVGLTTSSPARPRVQAHRAPERARAPGPAVAPAAPR